MQRSQIGGKVYTDTKPAQANLGQVLVYRPGQEGVYTDPGPEFSGAGSVSVYSFPPPNLGQRKGT